jgi:hypothetical protein
MRELEHRFVQFVRDARAAQERVRVVGLRLRSDTTRSSSRQPGSSRQALPGRARPATTTSAPAGNAGTNSSRSQSSSALAA